MWVLSQETSGGAAVAPRLHCGDSEDDEDQQRQAGPEQRPVADPESCERHGQPGLDDDAAAPREKLLRGKARRPDVLRFQR